MGRQKRDKQNNCGSKLGLKKGQLLGDWAGTGLGLGGAPGQGLVVENRLKGVGSRTGAGTKGIKRIPPLLLLNNEKLIREKGICGHKD